MTIPVSTISDTALEALVAGLFGLIIGSFLNVVIWRVPRGESLVTPASHCPSCDSGIAPYDNVPVLSWLVLRGRCRHCGSRISFRYPLVELLTAALFAAVGARFADSWALPGFLLFAGALVAISLIDLDHKIIPNRIVYPVGFAAVPLLALAAALGHDWPAFLRALGGGACAFACFYAVYVLAPRGGFGFGDVRLAFVLGMFLGWLGWSYIFAGLFVGFAYGAVIGVGLIAVGLRGRRDPIPFGPFLAAGAMTIVLWGAPVLDWYRSLAR